MTTAAATIGVDIVILGIDIGGSGVKGAPVDPALGELTSERVRVPTPQPSDVTSVIAAVREVVAQFDAPERVGVTFPGVVVDGVVTTAANMDKSWIGAPAARLFAEAVGRPAVVLNDADAAGVAEMTFGAGRGRAGTTLMLTFGTGIGSALFLDGRLVPNTEFGHLELNGHDAEVKASDRAREVEDLSWEHWAHRVERYLRHVELLLQPGLIIVGGGVSKKADKWLPLIDIRTPVVPAQLRNEAGIIGAAAAAAAAAAAHPAAETPAVAALADATPAVETPAVETPAAETPAAETPAAETPDVMPSAGRPVAPPLS
jgi:polyphosphate glucokinase